MLNFCQQLSYVMEHIIGIPRLSQKQKDLALQYKMQLAVHQEFQQTNIHQFAHNSKFT
jgi:hypothetical protein